MWLARSSSTRRICAASGTWLIRAREKISLRSFISPSAKRLPIWVSLMSPPSSSPSRSSLQRFGHGKQFVDLHLQVGGDIGQVGLAVIGRGRHRLDQTGDEVRRNMGQQHAEAACRGRRVAQRWRAVISV